MAAGNYTAYQSKAELYLNGRAMVECQNVSVTVRSNASDVNTIHKGRAGSSDGAPTVDVTIGLAVPKKGEDFDFDTAVVKNTPVALVYKVGGKRVQVVINLVESGTEVSTDSAARRNVTGRGGEPKFVGA